MKRLGIALLWLFLGALGSLGIVIAATAVLDSRTYPRIQSGGAAFVDYWDRGYVRANGTWVFEDDTKQAFPRQTTEIQCYRDQKECVSAQAEIALDMLSVSTDRFPITSWDQQSIVYTSRDPLCVSYTYTISRSTQRVTGQRQPKPTTATDSVCEPFEKRTFNLSLRDGFAVWRKLQADEQATIHSVMFGALGMWWAFVIYRIARGIRRGNWKREAHPAMV
ncbi:hypothetical protein [Bradyrhizobium guangdongense]|uniref:hypothetical protein n=1 Tax=Bradyrhizobium guangdongense TaxID=1325090 RepID=UPI0018F7D0E3|nr:hypothetical protein [Bradyrhizobium guangdongense]